MNAFQMKLIRIRDVTVKNQTNDAAIFALGSQSPVFVKKKFCASQSFSQNIKSWKGPVKACLPLQVAPLTDW